MSCTYLLLALLLIAGIGTWALRGALSAVASPGRIVRSVMAVAVGDDLGDKARPEHALDRFREIGSDGQGLPELEQGLVGQHQARGDHEPAALKRRHPGQALREEDRHLPATEFDTARRRPHRAGGSASNKNWRSPRSPCGGS